MGNIFDERGHFYDTQQNTMILRDAAGEVVYVSFMDRTNISTAQSFGYKFDHFMSCSPAGTHMSTVFLREQAKVDNILIW